MALASHRPARTMHPPGPWSRPDVHRDAARGADGALSNAASAQTARRHHHDPPGRLVPVDGRRVHVLEAGKGSPTVIFEAGMGGNVLDWSRLWEILPGSLHRLAYDRAGLGWSDPGPEPRSPATIVDELEALLRELGAEQPYIFVAHSMGSRYARLFAARHPGHVGGLVLVDGYHEGWDAAVGSAGVESFIRGRLRFWDAVALAGRLGVVRLLGGRLVSLLGPDFRAMPRDERRRYVEMLADPAALRVSGEELRHGGDSNEQLRVASFGSNPVVVISHGVPFRDAAQDRAWQESQEELVARSSRGRLVRAAASAHSVMIAEPALVADGIGHVLGG